ncbi:MAG: hypothetical protein COV72_01845 [Candidatus Omnitrophica bacterium CG11_big_fil_rev_8_21_14_0_20_42_13]|uniref:DUF3568 domain-containing protein n=1 Tax=Candidatus Ghiorseimicrobium undicola TaxID=1974746 RepID=A0A2H0LZ58_9BACT|nr:MAG: hypothetical protein COV72_01845 [Candidatus Omnitrophica bacterium CG11_big_fil_rev_8_21_14_0_20_42_13]
MGRKLLYAVVGWVFAINLCGCVLLVAGAAGGAGTALWLSGKLSDEVSAPYERTIEAAKKALKSLEMQIDKETKSDEVAQIRSNYTDGREVWIDIRPLTEITSKLEIRVGAKGDKEASAKILEEIKKHF